MHTDEPILDQLHVTLPFIMYEHIHKRREMHSDTHTHPPTVGGETVFFTTNVLGNHLRGFSVIFPACSTMFSYPDVTGS